MMPRKPTEIAAESRAHVDQCEQGGYPLNLVKLATLSAEFMDSAAATMQAAGLIPADPEPEQPGA